MWSDHAPVDVDNPLLLSIGTETQSAKGIGIALYDREKHCFWSMIRGS